MGFRERIAEAASDAVVFLPAAETAPKRQGLFGWLDGLS